jgi:hypothetical protein
MADLEKHAKPVIVTADDARDALGPSETSRGDTLIPTLVGGLVLIVIGIIIVLIVG